MRHGSDLNMASRVTLLAGMLTLITKSSSGFMIKISEDVSTQSCQEVLSNLEVGLLKICYLFSTSSTLYFPLFAVFVLAAQLAVLW